MRRRPFIAVMGGGLLVLPQFRARAQRPTMPVIGFLGIGPASAWGTRVQGLRAGLRDQGFVEGNNIIVEFRWADTSEELPGLAAELVRRNVAVMVAGGNSATSVAKSATSAIPIVFSSADDPVTLGFVQSFGHPGGNMTGVSLISGALGAKRLEFLRSLLPTVTVVALLTNPKNPAEDHVRAEKAVAREIGQQILVLEAGTGAEIERAFASLVQQQVGAVLVNADALFTAQRELLVGLAARHRVPAVYAWREFAEIGGLVSYGTSLFHAYRQNGDYIGRILKGERPSDLPVVQPTNFELVINLRTARTLGLTIPYSLQQRADEVIE